MPNQGPVRPEVNNSINSIRSSHVRSNEYTTPGFIENIMKHLPKRKAPGICSNHTNNALKNAPKNFIRKLTHIFNNCFHLYIIPNDWKNLKAIQTSALRTSAGLMIYVSNLTIRDSAKVKTIRDVVKVNSKYIYHRNSLSKYVQFKNLDRDKIITTISTTIKIRNIIAPNSPTYSSTSQKCRPDVLDIAFVRLTQMEYLQL